MGDPLPRHVSRQPIAGTATSRKFCTVYRSLLEEPQVHCNRVAPLRLSFPNISSMNCVNTSHNDALTHTETEDRASLLASSVVATTEDHRTSFPINNRTMKRIPSTPSIHHLQASLSLRWTHLSVSQNYERERGEGIRHVSLRAFPFLVAPGTNSTSSPSRFHSPT